MLVKMSKQCVELTQHQVLKNDCMSIQIHHFRHGSQTVVTDLKRLLDMCLLERVITSIECYCTTKSFLKKKKKGFQSARP